MRIEESQSIEMLFLACCFKTENVVARFEASCAHHRRKVVRHNLDALVSLMFAAPLFHVCIHEAQTIQCSLIMSHRSHNQREPTVTDCYNFLIAFVSMGTFLLLASASSLLRLSLCGLAGRDTLFAI